MNFFLDLVYVLCQQRLLQAHTSLYPTINNTNVMDAEGLRREDSPL